MRRSLFLFCLFLYPFLARTQVPGPPGLSGKEVRELTARVTNNEAFARGHTGFCLYDLADNRFLFGEQADQFFVPASNVKLVTFYVAQRLLGNRAPAIFYQEYPDHLEVWGAGYPLTLHPRFVDYDELSPWLRSSELPVVMNFPPRGDVPRYGAGWSWDDYNDGYVYERSLFPVYGNRLYLDLAPADENGRQTLVGSPPALASSLRQSATQERLILRSELGNNFSLGPDFFQPDNFPLERPINLSPFLITNELAASMPERSITTGSRPYPGRRGLGELNVNLPDTLYRRVMAYSDNFLAEQLLLLAAAQRYGNPSDFSILPYARDTLLPTIGVEGVRWVDGSGLSRYNLFTPRQMARIVMATAEFIGRKRFAEFLAVGGESGTLESRFEDQDGPFVYAKTGSLSGVVCLSGMLRTDSGRWLAFSFMHNNFVGSSRPYYTAMEEVLTWCRKSL
jgi:D-alanyl-D-alanine carboxypeptidase/D-alanyl-D-alanine-endopeptidase (penicillin-binding protein 4)